MLKAAQFDVRSSKDEFGEGVSDVLLIPRISARDWVLVTADEPLAHVFIEHQHKVIHHLGSTRKPGRIRISASGVVKIRLRNE